MVIKKQMNWEIVTLMVNGTLTRKEINWAIQKAIEMVTLKSHLNTILKLRHQSKLY